MTSATGGKRRWRKARRRIKRTTDISKNCTAMTDELPRKVDFAIRLLRSIPTDEGPVEISYSGGKDSDVILELAKMAGIPYRAIYKNSTIDPPGTIAHCRAMGAEILAPRVNFFDLVRRKGLPTRFRRFCCDYLKEYKVLDRAVHGIRRAESVGRNKRYKEPEVCRVYPRKQGQCRVYLPILEWTDEDEAEFIAERGIRCHPIYYDEAGNFHVERRLGCIGCPLRGDQGKADFLKYPGFLRQLIRALRYYRETHHDRSYVVKFNDEYEHMFCHIFFRRYEKYRYVSSGGLFPETAIDAKAFLEDYFKIDL